MAHGWRGVLMLDVLRPNVKWWLGFWCYCAPCQTVSRAMCASVVPLSALWMCALLWMTGGYDAVESCALEIAVYGLCFFFSVDLPSSAIPFS